MIKLTPRQELEGMYSDMYKDAHGIRPRAYNLSYYTEEELKERLNRLSDIIAENYEEDRKIQDLALVNFNKKIEEIIAMGAGDRKTALRWMLEGYDIDDLKYGADYFFFKMGLNDNNAELSKEINDIIRKILEKTTTTF